MLFATFNGLAFIHMFLTAPETKHKSLEEMDEVFDSGRPAWRAASKGSRLDVLQKDIEEGKVKVCDSNFGWSSIDSADMMIRLLLLSPMRLRPRFELLTVVSMLIHGSEEFRRSRLESLRRTCLHITCTTSYSEEFWSSPKLGYVGLCADMCMDNQEGFLCQNSVLYYLNHLTASSTIKLAESKTLSRDSKDFLFRGVDRQAWPR